ncbi:GIY-YIG nuclease family protein [Streptomyces sp. 8ZJF_21]|uniref:GIY-YIG nuclease family protein n=1 Tax=Streptomyces sp. 8ZJF_21 TaxID=2903141 RepID=UPI001E3FC6DD|nr:GIY-YIG nuclease family protein [Streptomyces sp. 8ZJF_21]MCD9593531.1 GIY-YIG nuclease family protein [Streptomyces sp. 8ZJF_21]
MSESSRGVIYILANSLIPGVLKIGRTAREPTERAREVSRGTGVPAEYEVIYDQVVSDAKAAERELHSLLHPNRVNPQREFFRVSIREAIRHVQDVCARYPVNEAREAVEIDALPGLEDRMRRWLRRDLVAVKFVQYSDLCLIKWVTQPDFRKLAAYENIFDLAVFGDVRERCTQDRERHHDEPECEAGEFCPIHYSPRENFELFLGLDQYSMIMTGLDILTNEAADYVAHLWEERRTHPPKRLGWSIVGANYSMMGPEEEWREALAKHGISSRPTSDDIEIISG